MNDKSIEALKKALATANGAMARFLTATASRKAQLELDARTALATLAATIDREDVF